MCARRRYFYDLLHIPVCMYLFCYVYCTLIKKYLVSEKYIDHIKIKPFIRENSGQKANENRKNKMMARVRLTPKVHVRHLTPCFQSTSKEVILIRYMSSQSSENKNYLSSQERCHHFWYQDISSMALCEKDTGRSILRYNFQNVI